MTSTVAIRSTDVGTLGVGVIVGLVVVGLVLILLIQRLIVRVVIALVVIVAAVVVWQQRSRVEDQFTSRACGLGTTFFGIHLDPPENVRQACLDKSR